MPWLDNFELEMRLALEPTQPGFRLTSKHDGTLWDSHPGGPDFSLAIELLIAYEPRLNRWLDQQIERDQLPRVLAAWNAVGIDWLQLMSHAGGRLAPVITTTKRLRGLEA